MSIDLQLEKNILPFDEDGREMRPRRGEGLLVSVAEPIGVITRGVKGQIINCCTVASFG